jgi:hypothetical protein
VLTSEGPLHATLRGGIEPHYKPRRVAEYIENLVRPLATCQLETFRAQVAPNSVQILPPQPKLYSQINDMRYGKRMPFAFSPADQ